MNFAVLLAAGDSKRMGLGVRKPFLELNGRWVLDLACEAFDQAESVNQIIIVCQEPDLETIESARETLPSLRKVTRVVVGGEQRIDSVRAGVAKVPHDANIIAIHDVARPLVRPIHIEQTIDTAAAHGAAFVAIPVTDTIKTSSDGYYSDSTLDRSVLWRAQTPQAFRADFLRSHLLRAFEEEIYPTDEIALHERYSENPALVRGSEENLKLTTPFDMLVAEAILNSRSEKA